MMMNALEALPARARGQVPAGSRLRDDLALSAVALASIVVGNPLLAFVWRRSPIAVFREMLSFARTHDERRGEASR